MLRDRYDDAVARFCDLKQHTLASSQVINYINRISLGQLAYREQIEATTAWRATDGLTCS